MHNELIEKYGNGGLLLEQSIRGLTEADLHAKPIAGKWSTHQVVIHLSDAEAAFADRIKRIIAMPEPALLSWDENQFIDRLHYDAQNATDAITVIDLTRKQLVRVLRKLTEHDFARFGTHSERGRQTLADVLNYANNHLKHHIKFIHEKREALGKLMW